VLFIRSTLFNLCLILLTLVFSVLILVCRPFSFVAVWFWAKLWTRSILAAARWICGIRLIVEGREHFPDEACVVLAKHQSAYETIAMPYLVPPYVWVLKRELFYIPIFGWALWAVDAIAIRRTNAREALKQVLEQGQEFLRKGRWVVMFPEGTRVAPGKTGDYQASGVMLAQRAKVGILPMAHNSGTAWPRRGFIKKPGTIRVRFLPLISADEVVSTPRNILLEKVKEEIETSCRELN